MSALYGKLWGYSNDGALLHQRPKTAQGHGAIACRLETWGGAVRVELRADGTFTVQTGAKSAEGKTVYEGSIK